MSKIPLGQQIEEVERGIAQMLERARDGAVLPSAANERLPKMFAVLGTLRWLEKNETTIRAAVKTGSR